MTENPKENFLKALDVVHTELKFSVVVYGAPIVAITAKLETIHSLAGTAEKSLFSISLFFLLCGLLKSIFLLNIFRMWRTKETLQLSGDIYKGHFYIEYFENELKKLNLTYDEHGLVNLARKIQWIDVASVFMGWGILIIGIFLVIWS